MSEVIITVRGESEARVAAERATISATARTEGAERTAIIDAVLALAEPLRASIKERADAGTVAEWTSKRLSVRAERPWNNEGKRLAPVYYASVDFTATFLDASELSVWVTDVSMWDGVEIGWVDWHLTPETRARVEREVAASAVGVAVARAEAYAGALGLTTVTARDLADRGLIGGMQGSDALPKLMYDSAAGSAPAMEYEPDEIVVSATVEARFSAR